MRLNSRNIEDVEGIVSVLNNYLEAHAYLVDGEHCGDASDIVSNYGFGYVDDDEHIFHWVEGGDLEVCSLTKSEICALIDDGLTDLAFTFIMEKCV